MDWSYVDLGCVARYVFGSGAGSCLSGNFDVYGDVNHVLNSPMIKMVGSVLIGVPVAAFFLRRFLVAVGGWLGGS